MKVFSVIINYISLVCIMLHDWSSGKSQGRGCLKASVYRRKGYGTEK